MAGARGLEPPTSRAKSLCWPIHIDEPTAAFPNRTGAFQRIRLSRSHFQTSCTPSPCLKHYLEHLSTMDTPSPSILRCLGDPQVIHLLWSGFRYLVRRHCSPAEIACGRNVYQPSKFTIGNPTNLRLRFRQSSFHHARPGCLTPKCQTFRPCYCPLHLFRILGKVVL